jgi:hypothetical protein
MNQWRSGPGIRHDGSKQRWPRESISSLLTEETITAFRDYLNRELSLIFSSFQPPETNEERERRVTVLTEATRKMTAAALLYLKKRDPVAYRALTYSCGQYARAQIRGENADFTVQHPSRSETFLYRAAAVNVLSMHRELTRRLRDAFRTIRVKVPRRGRPFTGNLKYGDAQWEGTKRYHEELRRKAELIQQVAEELLDFHVEGGFALDAAKARQWAGARRSPSEISTRILARILCKSIATVRNVVGIGYEQDRESREILRNRELGRESANAPSSVKGVEP